MMKGLIPFSWDEVKVGDRLYRITEGYTDYWGEYHKPKINKYKAIKISIMRDRILIYRSFLMGQFLNKHSKSIEEQLEQMTHTGNIEWYMYNGDRYIDRRPRYKRLFYNLFG